MSKSPGLIFDPVSGMLYPALIRRRDNAFYRSGMAQRYVKQLRYEGVGCYDLVGEDQWSAYRLRLIRGSVRYKSIPNGGNIIALSALGKIKLPDKLRGRIALLDDWIAAIPDKRAVGGTRGFGGEEYAGSYDRRKKSSGCIFLSGTNSDEFCAVLISDGMTFKRWGDVIQIKDIDGDARRKYVGEVMRKIRDYSEMITSVL